MSKKISEVVTSTLISNIAAGKITGKIGNFLILYEESGDNGRGCYLGFRKVVSEFKCPPSVFIRTLCGPMKHVGKIRDHLENRNDFQSIENVIINYTVGLLVPFADDEEIPMKNIDRISAAVTEAISKKFEKFSGLSDLIYPDTNYTIEILEEE